ncbi:glycosyltransferase [Arthrobacter tecti]
MRILLVHNSYRSEHPSGEDMVVDQERQLLSDAGHVVDTYARHSDDIASMGLTRRAELPFRVVWSVEDEREFGRVLDADPPGVIHLHNPFPMISASILRAARRRRVPVVMTLHNYRLVCAAATFLRNGKPCVDCLGHSPLPAVLHGCYRGSRVATVPLATSIGLHKTLGTWVRGVSKFIVMSEFARDTMTTGGLPADRIEIKPHFIPHPATLERRNGDYALYLGRLSEEKGADLLIKAWDPSFGELLVVGDGPQRQSLEAMAASHGDSVRFLGSLQREDAVGMLAGARYLVNPSRVFETFGLSVVEAFAHGVPAIVPSQGVFPELVRPGENGLIFASGDPLSLREALQRLGDTAAVQRMGSAARSDYLARFTPERNLVRLEEIYTDAIATAPAHS